MARFMRFLQLLLILFAVQVIGGCGGDKPKGSNSTSSNDVDIKKGKVLYVDSYHRGYEWSDGITKAILRVFNAKLNDDDSVDNSNSKVRLRIVRMDTKRNKSEEFKHKAALKVKAIIDDWKPDLIIASDDNASKYLIVPYFKDKAIPVVFCGVNGNADKYGYPFSNTTGMVEVLLIKQLVTTLEKFARGDRLAFIAGNSTTDAIFKEYFEEALKRKVDTRFVDSFEKWKQEYLKLQTESDMILITNGAGVPNWDAEAAEELIKNNCKVPVGGWFEWRANLHLITYAQDPSEQGEWAASTALKVLGGEDIRHIPCVKNKKASIYLNMDFAKKLGIKFPMKLIDCAHLVGFKKKDNSLVKPTSLNNNSKSKGEY